MENFMRNKFPDYKFFYVLWLNQRLIFHLEFLIDNFIFYRNDGSVKDHCVLFNRNVKNKRASPFGDARPVSSLSIITAAKSWIVFAELFKRPV